MVVATSADARDEGARDAAPAARRLRRTALACFALVLAALASAPASARVRVDIDRDPVVADESFTVTFTADTADQSEPDFTPLEKDFEILGRSSQTSLQIINGRPDARQSWVINLIAKRSGKVELPAIAFGNERSAPVVLDVRAAAPGAGVDNDVFITIEATPQPAYVQAQIVVIVRLYVGVQVGSASLSELTADGAVVEKLGDDRRREEARGGRNYTVFERRYGVFAERSGTLTLAPVEFAGELLGRGFFGRYKRTASEPMDLQILPAPAGIVPWLPATAVTLTEQWPQDPPVFHAGEPLTRTLTLTAKGLTAAQLPPLGGGSADGFKQYVDQPDLNDVVGEDGVTGVREEKIAFLPTQAGHYTLAPIEVTWWDTGTQSLQIVRVPEREVEVLPGALAQAPEAPASATQSPAPNADAAGALPNPAFGSTTGRTLWLAAVTLLGTGWLVTAIAWWWSSRPRRAASVRRADATEPAGLGVARRRLREACGQEDAVAAQAALLDWGRARWPDAEAGAWRELRSHATATLRRELDTLDRARYARDGGAWSGAALWRAFSVDAPEPEPRSAGKPALAPLHP